MIAHENFLTTKYFQTTVTSINNTILNMLSKDGVILRKLFTASARQARANLLNWIDGLVSEFGMGKCLLNLLFSFD